MTLDRLNIGVIGAGMMGRNHVRVLSELSNVELVGIADPDPATASLVADRYRCRGFAKASELLALDNLDAVVVATPTRYHHEVAAEALARGKHVLLEKPIASTVEEGQALSELAGRSAHKLMVGHIERFNPAVMALKQQMEAGALGQVFQIDVRRQGPFPTRIMDVGVTVDLAVHDIDAVRYVTGAEVTRVYAECASRVRNTHEDSLYGLLRLNDGVMANLTVNWLTPTKIRELIVTGEAGMFVVNYLTQDLSFYENGAVNGGNWETLGLLRGVGEGRMIRHMIARKEPLRAELEAFVECVTKNADVPVSATDGLSALYIAGALLQSARDATMIEPGTLMQGRAPAALTA